MVIQEEGDGSVHLEEGPVHVYLGRDLTHLKEIHHGYDPRDSYLWIDPLGVRHMLVTSPHLHKIIDPAVKHRIGAELFIDYCCNHKGL
jgi:hypothetical protein